jgi:hypothetical protein
MTANPIKIYRRLRARRQLANLSRADRARVLLAAMTPKESAEVLHAAIDSGRDAEIGNEVLALMADRAAEGAEGAGRTILLKIAAAYHDGREIKFSSFPVTLLREGETPELVFAVEDAFTNKEN